MERGKVEALLSEIETLWNKFVESNFEDLAILDYLKDIMPEDDVFRTIQDDKSDLFFLAWWCEDLSRFIRNNNVQEVVNNLSVFLHEIGAKRIIQKFNFYCSEGLKRGFRNNIDKRNHYLKLIEIYDEIKHEMVNIHYYNMTLCSAYGGHVFCRSYDAETLSEIMDIWLLYQREAAYIRDIIKDYHLPVELDTPRARKYIGKAIEKGFIASTGDNLKWSGTKASLAYFLSRIYCEDEKGKDNGSVFPESALNKLFGEDRLGKARSQLANNKKQGYANIDNLFN